MTKNLNIILGNAPINNGNRGCVALSYTSMYLIDKILSEANIAYKLYLPDASFPEDGVYTIDVAGKHVEYEQIPYTLPISNKDRLKKLIKFKKSRRTHGIFRNADYILDIGQGDSFADIYGKLRFDLINKIHREASKFHKPYCLLPQTIGPFKDPAIKAQAIKAIAGADMVMARDKQSYDYVINNVPQQKNVNEYIDVAFFLPYKQMMYDKNFIHVGLNISALLWHGGYTQDNQFGLKGDYQKTVRNIIDYFLSLPNVKLHLIPHVVGSERHIENDYAVSFDLQQEYGNPNLILSPLFLSPVDAKSYISGMDFFMGARMHSTIAAFSSGVPVVPMAYSRKFNGLFIDTLGYDHMADLKVDTEEEVLNKIKALYESRNSLKEEISSANSGIVEDRKQLLINDLKHFFHI